MKNLQIHFKTNSIAILVAFYFSIGCSSEKIETITFKVYVDGEPLEYGRDYTAPNGKGTFFINDFKLYISNIKLNNGNGTDGSFIEPESYHLLRFHDSNSFTFPLNNAPEVPYKNIVFSIGIDEKANTSIENPGDLDPTGQMAWNWTQGYKFLLLEGIYTPYKSNEKIPLVYHIGFSENKVDLQYQYRSTADLQFSIEITELFKNPNPVDFNELPKVLFNEKYASMLAQNYSNSFITLDH